MGLGSRKDYDAQKELVESQIVYESDPSRRSLFEDSEMIETEIDIHDKGFYEILALLRFLKDHLSGLNFKLIELEDGVEIRYYPEQMFEEWRKGYPSKTKEIVIHTHTRFRCEITQEIPRFFIQYFLTPRLLISAMVVGPPQDNRLH